MHSLERARPINARIRHQFVDIIKQLVSLSISDSQGNYGAPRVEVRKYLKLDDNGDATGGKSYNTIFPETYFTFYSRPPKHPPDVGNFNFGEDPPDQIILLISILPNKRLIICN